MFEANNSLYQVNPNVKLNLLTACQFSNLPALTYDVNGQEKQLADRLSLNSDNAVSPINRDVPDKNKADSDDKLLSYAPRGYCYKSGYKTELAKAYGELLQSLGSKLDWNWYATLTFKDPVHPESANKRFNRWIHKLNRKIYGCNYYKHKEKGVRWVKAIEKQKRGVIHFHCLVADVPDKWDKTKRDFRRLAWMDAWYKDNGIARIYPYDKTKGACYYLGKYVNKAESEIDFSNNIATAMQKQLLL